MPTSFSSCKAVLEILRREKNRGKINAHTGSPSSHTPALAQKPYQHLYEITFCPLEMPAGRSCQPCWLHFLSQSYPGAEASRALKPFVSPSCCPPHPLFPLLQHSQGGNRSVTDPLSLGSHPSFCPSSILGREAALTSAQPRGRRPPAPHSVPGSHSYMDPFPPAMLRACLTSHLSCLPFRVTQSSREPARAHASRATQIITTCSTSLGLPTVFLPFPSINMDAQLLLSRTNRGAGCKAAHPSLHVLPVLPLSRIQAWRPAGGSGFFFPSARLRCL